MQKALDNIIHEVREELEGNILPFWTDRMQDPSGGFHGRIDGHGKLVPGAEKGCILNARILWTFASAYRLLGRPEHLAVARRAARVIMDRFVDGEYGGTFWSLDAVGRPLDTKKQIYAIAFAIYGLSELHRACGDEEALECAVSLYRSIEEHSFDRERNGYLEALSRTWGPLGDMRLSDKDQNDAKTMNTHLHILEGYTALYRVWKDEGLADRLRNLILIFVDRILLPDGHLALFFDEDWNVTSHVTSYGHDIECSWLLQEAADVLGDEELSRGVSAVCDRIAGASLEGWTPGKGMVYERDLDDGSVDGDRHWWVQAETVVGCFYQWKRSGDPAWLWRLADEWAFIKAHIIAPDGEWYWSLRADGSVNLDDDRAGFWKCPYHNGRMCMELIEGK